MINRLGDFFILLSLGLSLFSGGFFFSSCYLCLDFNFVLVFFLLVSGMTKRAQMPFSSWLPKAISAPTPVSSLVHSSTLVVAGFYLIFNLDFYCSYDLKFYIIYFSILTSVLSRVILVYEFDVKKLVAITTLTQISYIFIRLGFGFKIESLFHLLIHAIYKSILFMSSGYLIFLNFNSQDIRMIFSGSVMCPLFKNLFIILNLSSLGFPFICGFYSKDRIIGVFLMSEFNLVYLIFFYVSLLFFFFGTFRLIYFMFIYRSLVICFDFSLVTMNLVILFMCVIMLFSGFYFFMFFNNYDLIYLNLNLKLINLFFIVYSLYVFYVIKLYDVYFSFLYFVLLPL